MYLEAWKSWQYSQNTQFLFQQQLCTGLSTLWKFIYLYYICMYILHTHTHQEIKKTESGTRRPGSSQILKHRRLLVLSKLLSKENWLSCQEGFGHSSDSHLGAEHLALSWKKSLVLYQYAQFSVRYMKWLTSAPPAMLTSFCIDLSANLDEGVLDCRLVLQQAQTISWSDNLHLWLTVTLHPNSLRSAKYLESISKKQQSSSSAQSPFRN